MSKGYWRETARSLKRAASARLAIATTGESPVAKTCQIPNLREKYAELGLDPRKGVFVEVGAYDGESFSNTSFLADQGWRGVYIEPIPEFFRRMKLRHLFNNVKGEKVAIAAEAGAGEMLRMDALSTMSIATSEHYKDVSWAQTTVRDATTITIETEPLEIVLSRNAVPRDFELMVVDVEGGEETIINSLVASPWRPRVLIVELVDVHPDFASNAELASSAARVRASLIAAGYREYYVDAINTIFAF